MMQTYPNNKAAPNRLKSQNEAAKPAANIIPNKTQRHSQPAPTETKGLYWAEAA